MADVDIRPARAEDVGSYVELYTAVASEGKWIGGEAPVDADLLIAGARAALDDADTALLVAVAAEAIIGAIYLHLERGVVGLGMMIGSDERGRGLGRRLLAAGTEWARSVCAHKMTLEVWPHNERALALYLRSGFVVEGRLARHHRRRSGELWDSIVMGLVLDSDAPGSPLPDAELLVGDGRGTSSSA
ncbi:MAG: GNAT family N-acetyltransferase [Acidimicrobiia bacterium]|nr:GNAT family N-acetyltransferase [Acidimicrobiia bacterium]